MSATASTTASPPLPPAAREAAVLLALAPVAAVQAAWLGHGVLLACALAAAAALAAEGVLSRLRKRRTDAHGWIAAAGTGAVLGLGLPPSAPAWLPLLGGALAVGLGRHALRDAPFPPAMSGLVALAALAPGAMGAPAALSAAPGPWALGAALAALLGIAALAWRGIARWTPLLAGLAGAAIALAALAAAGRAVPGGALPALALGIGVAALRGPWSAATPIARALAGLALGLLAAPLACAWPGLAGVAVALLAVGALTPALDAALARRARPRGGTASASPRGGGAGIAGLGRSRRGEAADGLDLASRPAEALPPRAAARAGVALGALLVAGLLALAALDAALAGGLAR